MIRSYIPRYRLVDGEGGRSHYVYQIEVCYNGRVHRVEKRYSAFHSLYKELRKYHPTADFPPKRVRNTTTKVLEARRSGLEVWLHSALQIQPVPLQLLAFLHIHNFQPPQIEQEESSSDSSPSHQPILYYSCDPHLLSHTTASLPNTVTKGVLTAIYDQSFKLPF